MLKMQKVGKSYMQKIVLQDLNLEVENGRIFGLIGAVGEGKTTLCRMIAGLIPIDEGEIYIDEKQLSRHPEIVRKKLGYVPRQFGRYRDMTCEEYLEYFGRLYGRNEDITEKKLEELLEMAKLASRSREQVDQQRPEVKKKLSLIRCLLTDPDVLVLDDFLVGLDVRERKELNTLLLQIRDMDKAILISSPGTSFLTGEEDCLGILQRGNIVVQGTLEEITEQVNRSNPLELVIAENCAKAVEVLKAEKTITRISMDGNKIFAGFEGTQEDQVRILRCLMKEGVPVISFQRGKSDLESVFWKLTE